MQFRPDVVNARLRNWPTEYYLNYCIRPCKVIRSDEFMSGLIIFVKWFIWCAE